MDSEGGIREVDDEAVDDGGPALVHFLQRASQRRAGRRGGFVAAHLQRLQTPSLGLQSLQLLPQVEEVQDRVPRPRPTRIQRRPVDQSRRKWHDSLRG